LAIMADTGGHFDFYKEIFEFLFLFFLPILVKSHVVTRIFVEDNHVGKKKHSLRDLQGLTDKELVNLAEQKVRLETPKRFTKCQ